jgi:hypothetical protein
VINVLITNLPGFKILTGFIIGSELKLNIKIKYKIMYNKINLAKCLGLLILFTSVIACKDGQKKGDEVLSEANALKEENVRLVQNEEEKKVDVFIDGKLFTSYMQTDEKPVLYPINTARGTAITRGYPLEPRQGERVDHPHHIGLWFNYGDVNGLDFWNNSYAIPEDEKDKFGSIVHKEFKNVSSGDEGILEVSMEWVGPEGDALLEENTTFIFRGTENKRTIDRITTLTALGKDVSMKDNKEGMLGIRVARQLEQPSEGSGKFTDASGNVTEVKSMDNTGITGMYRSSEGIEGDDVWGTRGEWVNLSGEIQGEKISVAILDHPDNVGYPTYWHARGYGLFAANPLGQKQLSDGKEELNFSLSAGESVTFKYRIVIFSGEKVGDDKIDSEFNEFRGN